MCFNSDVIDWVRQSTGGVLAKARRAKKRPARVVVPVILLALLIGVIVAATRGLSGDGVATTDAPGSDTPSVLATAQTAEPEESPSDTGSAGSDSSPSSDPSATSSGQPSTDAASEKVQQALQSCRAKLRARDGVISAADTGVGHWSEHVQAQTDANSGKISASDMQAIFKRTRLAGPADLKRYQAALAADRSSSGACTAPAGASAAQRTQFASCVKRSRAQEPALASGKAAMADWQSHLRAMQMSRMGHVNDAQGVWIRAWRAAPEDISAYKSAKTSYADAPAC